MEIGVIYLDMADEINKKEVPNLPDDDHNWEIKIDGKTCIAICSKCNSQIGIHTFYSDGMPKTGWTDMRESSSGFIKNASKSCASKIMDKALK